MNDDIARFCAEVGGDPALVQGAGGNVSWKENDVLWIKASGTWLADAAQNEIFVPVDLPLLASAIGRGEFGAAGRVLADGALRPSIETMLHALMPQRVVAHLHPVDLLAHLVCEDASERVASRMSDESGWVFVDYFKPGAELASAVHAALRSRPNAEIVFLRSHGVVLASDSVANLVQLMSRVLVKMHAEARYGTTRAGAPSSRAPEGYRHAPDSALHSLARIPELAARLQNDWALYPDHVVFLGPRAVFVPRKANADGAFAGRPPYVFLEGEGAFERNDASTAQQAQMKCYLDVIGRVDPSARLCSLDAVQVDELLGWDAERYRQRAATDLR